MTIYPHKLKRSELDRYCRCNPNSNNCHVSPAACHSSCISWPTQWLSRGREIFPWPTWMLKRCLLISHTEKHRWGELFCIWKNYSQPWGYWVVAFEWIWKASLLISSSYPCISVSAYWVPEVQRSPRSGCQPAVLWGTWGHLKNSLEFSCVAVG